MSYLVAATFTWYGNRRITFSPHGRTACRPPPPSGSVSCSRISVGGAVNYATYAALVSQLALVRAYPVLGVAAGSIAGLSVNFTLSKFLVFRAPRARS